MRDLILVKMSLIVQGAEQDKRITGPNEHPPCYESQYQYDQWTKAAEKMDGLEAPTAADTATAQATLSRTLRRLAREGLVGKVGRTGRQAVWALRER